MSDESNRSSDDEEHDDFDEVSPPDDTIEESGVEESVDSESSDSKTGPEDEEVKHPDEYGFGRAFEEDEKSLDERRREKFKEEGGETNEERDEREAAEDEEDEIDEEDILVETEEAREKEREKEAQQATSSEFNWREESNDAWRKIREWRADEYSESAKDVRTAPSRAKSYFSRNTNARDYIFDLVLPLTLVVYGLLLLFTSLIVSGGFIGNTLTEPSRIADLFLLDTVLLLGAAGVFVLARKLSSRGESMDVWRRRLRKFVIGLHLLPSLVFVLVLWNFIQPGLFEEWAIWFYEWRVYLADASPESIASFGEMLWSATPLGVTVQQIALGMVVLGALAAIPFALGIVKVFIVAINAGSEEELDELEALRLNGENRQKRHRNRREAAEQQGDYTPDVTRGEEVEASEDDVSELLRPTTEYTIEPYPNYEEHERYWVNKPYSYIVILYNEANSDYRYYVIEPEMTSKEEWIYEVLNERLSEELLFENVEQKVRDSEKSEREIRTRIIEDKSLEIAQEYNIEIGDKSFQKIMYYLRRDYVDYGKIDPMMNDPNTEDISCDGENEELFLFHQKYEDLLTNVKFESEELRSFIIELAQRSGEHISAADPMCDASLPDGSRAQLTLGEEVTARGSTFTLRIFQEVPFTPVDLITTNTFNVEQIAYLWLCIEHDMSLIFAGGTASGKTTTMNAVSLFIPPKSKIISLEDTRELTLPHSHWVPSVTRDSFGGESVDDIKMYDLLEAALRQRPEYLLVGEIRGEEAKALFQAMSTGHTTYSTMHADSVQSAVYRLKNPPINVPDEMIQALDIFCIQNQITIKTDDAIERARRNEKIGEVEKTENGFRVTDAFYRDPEEDEFISDIDDSEVLSDVKASQGWRTERLHQELRERKRVLEYMVDEGYDDVESVTRIVQAYIVNSERVINRIEDGTLDPADFDDFSEIETFDDGTVDEVLPHELEQEVIGDYA